MKAAKPPLRELTFFSKKYPSKLHFLLVLTGFIFLSFFIFYFSFSATYNVILIPF